MEFIKIGECIFFRKNVLVLLLVLLMSNYLRAQCNWIQVSFNSFEASGVVNSIIPASVYQNTPSNVAGCVHSGNQGLYLNIKNGYLGTIYDETYSNLCVGRDYRFSFWTKDTWGGSNNLTFQVLSATNVVLSQQNVINNGSNWQYIVMPTFNFVGTSVRFRMITNIAGNGGNDVAFDDLTLSACVPTQLSVLNASYCNPGIQVALDGFLSESTIPGGHWQEVTNSGGLLNDWWNTTGLSPGVYNFNYIPAVNGLCTFNQESLSITLEDNPLVDLGNDTLICEGQDITLTSGTYDNYLWNDNSIQPTLTVNQEGTYWLRAYTLGPNLINNGDFEQGITGFSSDYIIGNGGSWGQLSIPGTFAVTTSPNLVHNNFVFCNDHSNSGNKQLVVNGANVSNIKVWCQNVLVQPGTSYEFGAWATSVENTSQVAQLQFSINNSLLGTVFSPSNQACNWTQFTETWFSGLTNSVEICIVNQNIIGAGNDFSLDDITFKPICVSSDTIEITVSPNPVVDLGPDQLLCDATPLLLNAQNTNAVFNWNTQETTQTISPTQSGNYYVTVTNSNGCLSTDTVSVVFEEQLLAGNDNQITLCSTTDNYDLNVLLQNAATGGIWENQSITFTGVLNVDGTVVLDGQSGAFQFNYILNGNVCPSDTALFTLFIQQQPNAAPDQQLNVCKASGEIIDFSPLLIQQEEPIQGHWVLPINLPNNSFSPPTLSTENLQVGVYEFLYVLPAESSCINDTASILVEIFPLPIVDLGPDQLLCEGNELLLDAGNVGANVIWNTEETTQSIIPTQSGIYSVLVTNDNNCSSTDTISIVFEEQLSAGEDNEVVLCSIFGQIDLSEYLNDHDPGGVWESETIGFSGVLNADGIVVFDEEQTGTFAFNYIQNEGVCPSDMAVISLSIIETPVASFIPFPKEVNSISPSVQFNNTSIGNDLNIWNFGDGSTSIIENPMYTYPDGVAGSYFVELIIKNNFGCSDTASAVVVVKEPLLFYVPNCFTPDGDELNNFFHPVFGSKVDYYDFHLEIFNRWGELLFESYDVNMGWDGSYHGSLVNDGTYSWRIQFGLLGSDKDEIITGHVVVVR